MNNKKIRKDNNISIRCSDKDKEQIFELAKKEDKSFSEYVLSCCIPDKEKDRLEMINHRKRIGFINQMNHLLDEFDKMGSQNVLNSLKSLIKNEEDDLRASIKELR